MLLFKNASQTDEVNKGKSQDNMAITSGVSIAVHVLLLAQT